MKKVFVCAEKKCSWYDKKYLYRCGFLKENTDEIQIRQCYLHPKLEEREYTDKHKHEA